MQAFQKSQSNCSQVILAPLARVENSDSHTIGEANEQQDQAANSSEEKTLCMVPASSFYAQYVNLQSGTWINNHKMEVTKPI